MNNKASKISSIIYNDGSTWEDKIFITFDIDWCNDEILSFVLDIVKKYKISSTFFVTHYTPLLEELRKYDYIELGIHPNFNFLLQGDFKYGRNYKEVVEFFLNMVPEAVTVRSHSMTQNTYISDFWANKGIKYECNCFIPVYSDIILKPFQRRDSKITIVPYFWEDDVFLISDDIRDIKKYISYPGLKVFDFHPIHIYLNTDSMYRYNQAKKYINSNKQEDIEKLRKLINEKNLGIRDVFLQLIENIL